MADTNRSATLSDWKTEEDFWRSSYSTRPYIGSHKDFEYWSPAYRYGFESAHRYSGRNWSDVENDLRTGWDRYEYRGPVKSTWEEIKDAVRDGWNRITGNR